MDGFGLDFGADGSNLSTQKMRTSQPFAGAALPRCELASFGAERPPPAAPRFTGGL
jgi:hypothetical protein